MEALICYRSLGGEMTSGVRLINTIAWEARRDMGAKVPQSCHQSLRAMFYLKTVSDVCIHGRADEVVRDFLETSRGWRGDTARRLKAELRELVVPLGS